MQMTIIVVNLFKSEFSDPYCWQRVLVDFSLIFEVNNKK